MENQRRRGPTPTRPQRRPPNPSALPPIALTITTRLHKRQSAATEAAATALRLELLLLLPRTQSCVSSFFFFHRVFLFNPVSSTLLARPFVRSRPLLPPLAQVPSRAREIKNSKSQRRKQRSRQRESKRHTTERERARMRERERERV